MRCALPLSLPVGLFLGDSLSNIVSSLVSFFFRLAMTLGLRSTQLGVTRFFVPTQDMLKGVIDLADVLRIQPKVLSVKYEFVFALHCQKAGEKIRSYFLASNVESDRDEWVELLKPEIEMATRRATVVDTRTDAVNGDTTAAGETLIDLIDTAELWPIISRKLGNDLLSKVRLLLTPNLPPQHARALFLDVPCRGGLSDSGMVGHRRTVPGSKK